jgi:uncharacterized protein (DUF433 family)
MWQFRSEGDSMNFDRITVEPEKLEGKPSVRGLRITVETVVRLVTAGWTFDQILAEYPDLEREDIRQALGLRSRSHAAAGNTLLLIASRKRQPGRSTLGRWVG